MTATAVRFGVRPNMMADRSALAELAQAGRAAARVLSDAAWKLDAALSAERKASAGYRQNPIIGDAPYTVDPEVADHAAEGLRRTLVDHGFRTDA